MTAIQRFARVGSRDRPDIAAKLQYMKTYLDKGGLIGKTWNTELYRAVTGATERIFPSPPSRMNEFFLYALRLVHEQPDAIVTELLGRLNRSGKIASNRFAMYKQDTYSDGHGELCFVKEVVGGYNDSLVVYIGEDGKLVRNTKNWGYEFFHQVGLCQTPGDEIRRGDRVQLTHERVNHWLANRTAEHMADYDQTHIEAVARMPPHDMVVLSITPNTPEDGYTVFSGEFTEQMPSVYLPASLLVKSQPTAEEAAANIAIVENKKKAIRNFLIEKGLLFKLGMLRQLHKDARDVDPALQYDVTRAAGYDYRQVQHLAEVVRNVA